MFSVFLPVHNLIDISFDKKKKMQHFEIYFGQNTFHHTGNIEDRTTFKGYNLPR